MIGCWHFATVEGKSFGIHGHRNLDEALLPGIKHEGCNKSNTPWLAVLWGDDTNNRALQLHSVGLRCDVGFR
jgi:hypothetical protein